MKEHAKRLFKKSPWSTSTAAVVNHLGPIDLVHSDISEFSYFGLELEVCFKSLKLMIGVWSWICDSPWICIYSDKKKR